MLPQVLDLQNPPIDNAEIMREVRAQLSVFSLDLIVRIWRDADLAKNSREILAGIDVMLASAAELDDPGLTWVYQLYELLDEARARSPAIGILLFGTTCLYLGSFWWFDGRIEDVEFRKKFRRVSALEMRKLYAGMEQRMSILLADVGRCIAGQIDAVDPTLDL